MKINQMGSQNVQTLYLAGGCFWGVEGYFKKLHGVLTTTVGYANGKTEATDYHALAVTDHAETLKVRYDAYKISLEELLDHFFRIIDPTTINKQGNDVGRQYRTGIYSEDGRVLERAREIIEEKQKDYERTIRVEVAPLLHFIEAEDYHQDYLDKNPGGYCHINLALADEPLDYPKKEPESDAALKARIGDVAYDVVKHAGTERPFTSRYDKFDEEGIYVDIVTGEPLYSSRDKYDAGCGWPSFTKPIVSGANEYRDDYSFGHRTEVRSTASHLGHVFEDGPAETGHLRYCINGAALEFISYDEMDEKGYGNYKKYVK
ncbi:peptide-methionine (R)-S-oxide reductase MsrB [Peptoniphilus equinus]|uniref:Peptide methionine sulfoxide reductase MsrA n=1 Tax=Peptoniphilus equinus TaxID=3016343 RepID=A0ABY7QW36_9FIRM|nr:peptide-methionine (R)-S-oxide reductase MsrB [Peptoniphilus equinus]WBW50260.1 peptide-methionine (R)-S-oxide reductase MsrB [Peptoniphilus equinus]